MIEEDFRQLKPVFGEGIDLLWSSFLLDDKDGKREIEDILPLLKAQGLNKNFDEQIMFVPPSELDSQGEYPLGVIWHGEKPLHKFYLKGSEIQKHTGIFGISGSGKTNCVYTLIDSLRKNNKPFLILDWKANYRKLAVDKNVLVFTVGRDISPFYFNPLIPPKGVMPQAWIKALVDVVSNAYFLGEGVQYLLQETIDKLYKEFGVYSNSGSYPTFRDVEDSLKRDMRNCRGRQSLWYASTMRTLGAINFGVTDKVVNVKKQFPIEKLLEKNVILELDFLGEDDKTFLVESLLLWIYFYKLINGQRKGFEHAIIIEESQNILSKKSYDRKGKETILDIIFRQIRELGEGIIFLSQNPSLINIQSFGNSFTSICFNLKHFFDIETVGSSMGLKETEKKWLSKLDVGEAIVKLQGRYPHPFMLRVPLVKNEGTVDDADLKSIIQGYSGDYSEISSYSNNSEVISVIPDKDISSSPISDNELILLMDVYEHPISKIIDRYNRLGLTCRAGNESKDFLLKKEMISFEDISTNNGRIKILKITDNGKDILRDIGVEIKDVKKFGDGIHRYWVNEVANNLVKNGFNVEVEKDNIDVVAFKDVKTFAFEIETGKSDVVKNIEKCLAFGFDKIYSIMIEKELVEKYRDKFDSEKVEVVYVKDFMKK